MMYSNDNIEALALYYQVNGTIGNEYSNKRNMIDLTLRDKEYKTCLMWALLRGYETMLDLLLNKDFKANIEALNKALMKLVMQVKRY